MLAIRKWLQEINEMKRAVLREKEQEENGAARIELTACLTALERMGVALLNYEEVKRKHD